MTEVKQVAIRDLRSDLTAMEPQFKMALPSHISPDKFIRTVLTAIQNKPELQKADKQSLFSACMLCAQDGLLPDNREAALIEYGGKVRYQPMVAGIKKKARNSGELLDIVCQVVYKNDIFKISYVTDEVPVTHEPNLEDRGEVRGVYAVTKFKDGAWSQPEWMTIKQVEAIRKRSKSPNNGPWATDWEEMARKTVIRRHAKYLPSSSDKEGNSLQDVVERDDDMYELNAPAVDADKTPVRKQKAASSILEGAQTIEHQPTQSEALTTLLAEPIDDNGIVEEKK